MWTCADDEDKPMSKKGLKKQQKEAEKAAKKQQQQEQAAVTAAGDSVADDAADCAAACYGVMPMIQSKEKIDQTIVRVGDLNADRAGEKVWIRGRLHTSRAVGKQCFFVVRQQHYTVQALLFVGQSVSKQMVKFVSKYVTEQYMNVSS